MKENEGGETQARAGAREAEREESPSPRLDISTRTVSECPASGADNELKKLIEG